MVKRILWDREAREQFKKIILYIRKKSYQSSLTVKAEVLIKISGILPNPEIHPPDKFKISNDDKLYRAFELYSIRISYFINGEDVIIIKLRHTKMETNTY
jgi:plasmid stabilization system protein ParE